VFPRPARDERRDRPWLAEVIHWLLTVSTAVRTLALGAAAAGVRGGSLLAAVGGVGQVAAAVAFVVTCGSASGCHR